MGVINVTNGTNATLTLSNVGLANVIPAGTNGISVPFMQDITVNATPGTVRYSTLDSPSSSAFTTVNENSISLNILVDSAIMFGDGANTINSVVANGLFGVSKAKEEIFFAVTLEGTESGANYITGKGFLGGLAPSASIDQAIFISPLEIVVNGELTNSTV